MFHVWKLYSLLTRWETVSFPPPQNTNLVHNSFNLQQYICYTTLLNMFRAACCSKHVEECSVTYIYCWRLKELCTKLVFWKVYAMIDGQKTSNNVSFLFWKLQHEFRLLGEWLVGCLVGLDIATYIKSVNLFCRRFEFCGDLPWIWIYSTIEGKVLHACILLNTSVIHIIKRFRAS